MRYLWGSIGFDSDESVNVENRRRAVLSNIFCSVLILTTRPFRLYDRIEVLENGEKAGLKGRVVDINLIYTTLQEEDTADAQPDLADSQ